MYNGAQNNGKINSPIFILCTLEHGNVVAAEKNITTCCRHYYHSMMKIIREFLRILIYFIMHITRASYAVNGGIDLKMMDATKNLKIKYYDIYNYSDSGPRSLRIK